VLTAWSAIETPDPATLPWYTVQELAPDAAFAASTTPVIAASITM